MSGAAPHEVQDLRRDDDETADGPFGRSCARDAVGDEAAVVLRETGVEQDGIDAAGAQGVMAEGGVLDRVAMYLGSAIQQASTRNPSATSMRMMAACTAGAHIIAA